MSPVFNVGTSCGGNFRGEIGELRLIASEKLSLQKILEKLRRNLIMVV